MTHTPVDLTDEQRANLNAAAPEMLEALQAIDEAQAATDEEIEMIERAEAEGWSNDPSASGHLGDARRAASKAWDRATSLRRAAIAKATGYSSALAALNAETNEMVALSNGREG